MEYSSRGERHRSSFDSKAESPRIPPRMSFDSFTTQQQQQQQQYRQQQQQNVQNVANQLRASFDARDLSRASLDIKDIVRASFQKERSRSSVDGRDSMRESPRFGGSRYNKDPPRSSVDARELVQTRSSVDSPRLSMRLKEAVRAAVEGRLDSVRSSFDSNHSKDGKDAAKDAQRSTSNRSRETPRSSSTDSRLLVELRESPRLSRDAPRYSCDGRDSLRSSNDSSRDSLRAVAQRARESPRLSVDGRGGPVARAPVEERESPRSGRELYPGHSIPAKDYSYIGASQGYSNGMMRSEGDGRDHPNGEPRRRVPSLVARLMGLEDLPDEKPFAQQSAHQQAVPQQITVPQKKPSKESKLLKGLLQYNPHPETKTVMNETPRQMEAAAQEQQQPTLKHMFTSMEHAENVAAAQQHASFWNSSQDSPRQLKLSPKHLGMEAMPSAFKQQEAREIGALRQKVVQAMPKQLTEAVLTVLKNSEDSKRMPMSYSDMENRLRQLRLRSSLQEHKTLRQILEAMQSKGLLNGASRPKEIHMEHHESRQEEEVAVRPQQEQRYQNASKQIMLPKPQDYSSEAVNASKARNQVQELKKLGSRLHEQVFGNVVEESMVKPMRTQPQAVTKPARNVEEQQSASGASIVVMKPIGKPVKKTRSQNPALLIEGMPGARSPQRGRESPGRTSPWGSPVNRHARTQPGYGFGRESTGRFNSEESAAFKTRRDRILARTSTRDIQSEPSTPRSPKMIALPQSTVKLRSSSVPREAPESLRQLKLTSGSTGSGNKIVVSGRRGRSTKEKEENPKTATGGLSSKSQSRDVCVSKKTVPEPEQQQKVALRRSNSDGKIAPQLDKEGNTKSTTGPSEVTILRNRSSMGKRVSISEPDSRTSTPSTPKKGQTNGSKSGGTGDNKTNERNSPGPAVNQGNTTPRGSLNSTSEHTKKKEESGVLDHVRVTDGDATDQSTGRSPLVGLTNRIQSPEVGSGELERDGVRTPRAGILVKKMFANQEDGNLVAEIIDIASENPQPSPVSVLDGASFHEDDLSPLTLSKAMDEMHGDCDDECDHDIHFVQQANTALQEWRQEEDIAKDITPVEDNSQQLQLLREAAKIVPPQGELKHLILQTQAEKVYVRDILVVSGAATGMKAVNPSGYMIDSTVFDYLEEKQGSADYGSEAKIEAIHDSEKLEGAKERQVLDRRMLFDCVNDVLATLLVPYVNSQPWLQGLHVQPLRKRPIGQDLVQQLWDQLQDLPPKNICEDICDSLYTILQKDLTQPRNSWSDYTEEIEDIGLEIEEMIFKDLVEETLFDLTQSGLRRGLTVH